MQAEFTALRDCHGNAVVPIDGLTISDWEQQTFLASGSLISSGCKAALMLSQHPDALQQQAYEFGKQIALAYQVCAFVENSVTVSTDHWLHWSSGTWEQLAIFGDLGGYVFENFRDTASNII